MGVPQTDGGLPATVMRAKAIVSNCVRVAMTAHKQGGSFIFESPMTRGQTSRFAIEGKAENVDMSTHEDMVRLTSMTGAGRIFFDQCVFGTPSPNIT
eukprot:6182724-Pleurochrysis_carterae.AAC.1